MESSERAAQQAGIAICESFGIDRIDLAIVLGSGWSAAADQLGTEVGRRALAELPGFHPPSVSGHGGELLCVRTPAGKMAAVFTGRTHYYEGHGVDAVVHGVRSAAAAGASTLVLTNGSGSLRSEWGPGTPVLISDHINLTGQSPLRGADFVDMSDAYDEALRAKAREVDPSLVEGVYVQFPGPQYETPAEVRMAGAMGGDLVGMSTALETIAAKGAKMRVLGLSLATNFAAGIGGAALHHEEVIAAGKHAAPRLAALLRDLVMVL